MGKPSQNKRQIASQTENLLGANIATSIKSFRVSGMHSGRIGVNFGSQAGFIEIIHNGDGLLNVTQPFIPVPKLASSTATKFPITAQDMETGISVETWQEVLKSGLTVVRARTVDSNNNQISAWTITNNTKRQYGQSVTTNGQDVAIMLLDGVYPKRRYHVYFLDIYGTKLSSLTKNPYLPPNKGEKPFDGTQAYYSGIVLSKNRLVTVAYRYQSTNDVAKISTRKLDLKNWVQVLPTDRLTTKDGVHSPKCILGISESAFCTVRKNAPSDNIQVHTVDIDNTLGHPGIANQGNGLGSAPKHAIAQCPDPDERCNVVFYDDTNGDVFVVKALLNDNGAVTNMTKPLNLRQNIGTVRDKGLTGGVLPDGTVVVFGMDSSGNLIGYAKPNFANAAPRWPLALPQMTIAPQTNAPGLSITTSSDTVNNNNNPTKPTAVNAISLPNNAQQSTTGTILSMLESSGITFGTSTTSASFDMMQTTGVSLPMPEANTPAGISTGVIAGGIAAFFGLLYCVAVLLGVFYKLRSQNKDDIPINTLENESANSAVNPSTRISVDATSADVQTQQTSEEGYDKFPTPPVIQYDQDEFASARNSAGPNQYKSMTNGVFTNQYDTVEQPLHTGETEKRPSQYDAAHDPLHTGETEMRRW